MSALPKPQGPLCAAHVTQLVKMTSVVYNLARQLPPKPKPKPSAAATATKV